MKQVHWQLPFASLNGTQYRIDIYDDADENANANWPIQLVGGATPFTTDEDNSDDFFAPVRSQTGCINIVDEDGTLMADIMPKDNVDKPVRLIRVSDGAVMWQGFLSCETYSQAYTSRPNEVTLNVNSVLEAMDSVEISIWDAKLTSIGSVIANTFLRMNELEMGISEYYLPLNSIAIANKFIDTTMLFDKKENCNGNDTYYSTVGYSLKEILSCVCTFMGWTVREEGEKVYFSDAHNTNGYRRFYKIGVYQPDGTIKVSYTVDMVNTYNNVQHDMADSEWRGTDHTIDTRQGAKSVEVVAKVKDYDITINLQEVPETDAELTSGKNLDDDKFAFVSCSHNQYYHDNIRIAYPTISGRIYMNQAMQYGVEYNPYRVFQQTLIYAGANSDRYKGLLNPRTYMGTYAAGAFYAKGELSDEQKAIPDTKDGMYFAFFPYVLSNPSFDASQTEPIVKFRSVLHTRLNGGYLRIDGEYFALYACNMPGLRVISLADSGNLAMTLRIGNKFWDADEQEWTTEQTIFKVPIELGGFVKNWDEDMGIKETEGHLIPVNSELFGEMELWIWPQVENLGGADPTIVPGAYNSMLNEAFFSELNVDYVPMDDFKQTDRSENHYYTGTGSKFDEEVVVNTEFATIFSNNPSPSLVMNSETEPMTTLAYADGTKERPEVHLLNRLREYYKSPRRLISLEMGKPDGPLPLVRVTGYDKKTYLPLSESRDWRMGVSTIRCFEMPE